MPFVSSSLHIAQKTHPLFLHWAWVAHLVFQLGRVRVIGALACPAPTLMGEGGAQEGRRPARVSPDNYGARCYVGRQPTKDKCPFDIFVLLLSHSPTPPILFVPPLKMLSFVAGSRYAHRPPGNVLASGPPTWCPCPYFALPAFFLPSSQ